MIDGVHFRRAQLTPREIGRRALAGALSDLAAMGVGEGGIEALLALGVPTDCPEQDVVSLVGGARELADRTGAQIAGGDITRAPALSVAITVIGWTRSAETLVGRDGARPGDLVAVTGTLGGSGAGLVLLDGRAAADRSTTRRLREAYAGPVPRLELGQALAEAGARAMIDISDGLAGDAEHLARCSGVRLELELERLPVADGVAAIAEQLGTGAGDLCGHGRRGLRTLRVSPARRAPQRRTAAQRAEADDSPELDRPRGGGRARRRLHRRLRRALRVRPHGVSGQTACLCPGNALDVLGAGVSQRAQPPQHRVGHAAWVDRILAPFDLGLEGTQAFRFPVHGFLQHRLGRSGPA